MLQRAASSAYSWWWASHIRTTQSKWLDTNLQEMEARVKAMIKLIGADADSFAKKAELYFKSRPELINHVEEMYRSYQALADRYDRISGELHKANHTIATACPEQVQFTMQDGDGDGFPKALTGIDLSNFQPPPLDGPPMNLQGMGREISPFPENLQPHKRITSQMSKEKAQGEIDSLQKQILGLQTEKEFVKSSYETGLAKYSDIERQIREMQDEVCNLQEFFSTSATIKDNEVQALMTVQAIMSCKDTLVSLQDQQKKSFEEARKEFQRIKEARQKLKIFKSEYGQHHDTELSVTMESADDDGSFLNECKLDLQAICQKVEERFELCSKTSVAELAQKVDGLVDKVISIELATSLQNAQINRMSSQADELHKHLQALEEDKAASIGGSKKLTDRPKQVEEVLKTVHQIEKSIQNERVNIHKQLTEACFDLTDFVEKLHAPKFQNGEVVADSSQESKGTASEEDNAKGTAPKPRTLTELLVDDSGLTTKGNIHEQLTEAYGGHTDLVERLYVSEPQKGEVIVNSSQESKGIAFEEDDAKGTAPKPGTQTELLRDDSRLPIKGNACKQLTEACNDHSDFVERLCAPELEDSEVVSQESGTASEEYDEKGQAELLQDDSGLTSRGNIDKQSIEACDNRTGSMEELCASEPQNSEVVVDTSQESKGIASEEDDAKGTAPVAGTLTEILQDVSGLTSKSVNKESSDSFEDCKDTQDEESEGPLVWQQVVLNGLEGKDTILLKDYISILRNYKDTKQRLSEIEKKNQEDCLQAMSEVRELRSANAMKDEEIRFLWRMLCSLKAKLHASLPQNIEKPEESPKTSTTHISGDKVIAEVEEYIKQCQVQGPHVSSVVEKKFRAEIDRLLEENLDFWLRFTTSYHQTRSFKALFDKLKAEMDKLTDAQAQEASETVSASHQATKLGSAAIEKKVQELNTDLQVWLEKNVLLKGELESRFSSLCSMQEEISKITTLNQTDEVCFTPFQAAKFQGEVLNMKQENNKVAKELEAELDLVRGLQVEAGRVLLKLRESFELSVTRSNRVQQNFRNLSTKAGVPLRTFLFGKKRKKSSIFSCMNPSVHKQHRDMAGHPR